MNKPWQASAAAISTNLNKLNAFRYRNISSYGRDDKTTVLQLFESFQEALKKSLDNRKSPVSVGKTLSLFAPGILPIGDSNIAHTYGCIYVYCGAEEHVGFIDRMKIFAEHVERCVPRIDDWPLLKRIDEYNYSKYTMHWLSFNKTKLPKKAVRTIDFAEGIVWPLMRLVLSAISPALQTVNGFRYAFHTLNRNASLLPIILNVLGNPPLNCCRYYA